MPTEMELALEQTQQGISYEVSVDPHGFEGYLKMVVEETKTRVARDLMNKVDKMAENSSNKRKWKGDHGESSSQNKGHRVIRAHAVGPSNKKVYAGKLPHCNKCKLHHNRSCTTKCENCKEVGHLARDCRGTTVAANQRAP
ncbi:reverse transcriptase domain-containing protein [Tanacetum coccineum]